MRFRHHPNPRKPQRSRALSYYLVFAPAEATVAELAGQARLRWTIEECLQR
jgi:hypothetical protein